MIGLLPVAGAGIVRLTPVDREPPAFDLQDIHGLTWNVAALEGKPWVINFWASWCPPCVAEIPSMNQAWKVLEPAGVGMLAINIGDGPDGVAAFMQDVMIDFPVLLGDSSALGEWSGRALPTTVIVNAEGKVVYEAIGPREWDDADILERVLSLR